MQEQKVRPSLYTGIVCDDSSLAPTEMFFTADMRGSGQTMFAPTINNHRRRRYLHSSFLTPHSSLLIPHP